MIKSKNKKVSFFEKVPHAITLIFSIIILVTALSYIVPAGTYERLNLNGRITVIPNSYKTITSTPVNLLNMFKAIPLGFKAAAEIIFIVLAGGIMFGFMEKSKAIENAVGTLIKKLGLKSALSDKLKLGKLIILDGTKCDGKTSTLKKTLESMGVGKALIISGKETDENFIKAANNLKNLDVLSHEGINVYDILKKDNLIIVNDALRFVEERLSWV